MVRVCNGELLGAETALQFARVERAVVVAFKPVKYLGRSGLCFG
jgi:hypothetical protein